MAKESLFFRAAGMFDIPQDSNRETVHVEMTGNREVFIENHKGIAELSEEEVVISLGKGSIRVFGCGLSVAAMNVNEIRLLGKVESLKFDV